MKYNFKYAYNTDRFKGQCKGSGNSRDPSKWITGPDPLAHDKHYAYLKHKAQAKYRGEQYNLTLSDWQQLWTDEYFALRGRRADALCLYKIDIEGAWEIGNVKIGTRKEYLSRGKEYRSARS